MGFIRKFKKFTLRIIATANILVVAVLCATGYAGYVDPTAHPSCEVLTLAFPIPLLFNLGFLLFWLVFHYKYAWIPIAGFLVCASPVRTYCPFNFGKDAPSDGVKVMSFNAHVFNYINNGKDLPNTAVDYVCNSGADIVCLQEASIQRNKERLKAQLKAVYPYKEDERDKNRELISVYSKYPIIRHEVVNLCGERNLCGAFYIDMGTDTLLVINCHFEATRLSDEERDEFGKFVKRHFSLDCACGIYAVGNIVEVASVRQCDISAVIAVIERCPLQVITEGGKSLRRPVGDLLPGVSYDAEGLQSVLNHKAQTAEKTLRRKIPGFGHQVHFI